MTAKLSPERVERLDELNRRVAYVMQNFASARMVEREYLDFNDSLRFLRDALRGKLPADATRRRIHPLVEMCISFRLEQRGVRIGASPDDVAAVLPEISKALCIKRGRPSDATLAHTVRGLMVAWRWATGKACTVKLKDGNDEYAPIPTSRGADLIVRIVRQAEPSTTKNTILRCIYDSRTAIKGKSFSDYFPFYGATIDPDTGVPILRPGLRLESFIPAHPIYCSVGAAE